MTLDNVTDRIVLVPNTVYCYMISAVVFHGNVETYSRSSSN